MLGHLFYLIVKEQFEKIRDGDPFWYEKRLSPYMVKHINKTRLSDIIKRNTCLKNVHIPKNVFVYCCKPKKTKCCSCKVNYPHKPKIHSYNCNCKHK